jgi:hypothetical protein
MAPVTDEDAQGWHPATAAITLAHSTISPDTGFGRSATALSVARVAPRQAEVRVRVAWGSMRLDRGSVGR